MIWSVLFHVLIPKNSELLLHQQARILIFRTKLDSATETTPANSAQPRKTSFEVVFVGLRL